MGQPLTIPCTCWFCNRSTAYRTNDSSACVENYTQYCSSVDNNAVFFYQGLPESDYKYRCETICSSCWTTGNRFPESHELQSCAPSRPLSQGTIEFAFIVLFLFVRGFVSEAVQVIEIGFEGNWISADESELRNRSKRIYAIVNRCFGTIGPADFCRFAKSCWNVFNGPINAVLSSLAFANAWYRRDDKNNNGKHPESAALAWEQLAAQLALDTLIDVVALGGLAALFASGEFAALMERVAISHWQQFISILEDIWIFTQNHPKFPPR